MPLLGRPSSRIRKMVQEKRLPLIVAGTGDFTMRLFTVTKPGGTKDYEFEA